MFGHARRWGCNRLYRITIIGLAALALALLVYQPGHSQTGYNASYQAATPYTTTGPDNVPPIGKGIVLNGIANYHQIIWTVTGAPAACTVALDSSPDGSAWSAGGVIAGQTCTANGSSAITNVAGINFARINVTALSAGATLAVRYIGWTTNPSGGGGLADPGSNGVIKRTALGVTAIAGPGDYTPTNFGGSLAGDVTGPQAGNAVQGLKGQPLPALGTGYPHWNGAAFVWDTPGTGGAINPGTVGPGTNNYCYTDGTININVQSCVTYFRSNSKTSGIINDNRPMDITTDFWMTSPKFAGIWNIGTGTGGTTPTPASPSIWITEVPLVIPAGMDIIGTTGPGIVYGGDDSGVSAIMTGPSFPSPLGSPGQIVPVTATEAVNTVTLTTVSGNFPSQYVIGATPAQILVTGCRDANNNPVPGYTVQPSVAIINTVNTGAGFPTLTYTDPTGSLPAATQSCFVDVVPTLTQGGAASGSLANGTYFVKTGYTNNLMGAVAGNPVAGVSTPTLEQSFTISGCAGSNCSINVTSPAAVGSAPFAATGFYIASSTTSGQEVAGCNQTLTANSGCSGQVVTCGGVVDTSDNNGACLLGSTAVITAMPGAPAKSGTGAFAPPVADLTNPVIVVGDRNSSSIGNSNAFGNSIRNLLIIAGPTYSYTPQDAGANKPMVGIWNYTAQEATQIENIGFWGGFCGALIYDTHGNKSGYRGIEPYSDKQCSDNTSPFGFYNFVSDSCYYGVNSVISIYSSSFNYKPSCGAAGCTAISHNVYARGCGNVQNYVNIYATHFEQWLTVPGSDNINCDWSSNCGLWGGELFDAKGAGMHRTLSGNAIKTDFTPQQGFIGTTRPLVADDPRSLAISPNNLGFPVTYDSVNYTAKAVMLSAAYTSALTTTFKTVSPKENPPLASQVTVSGNGVTATLALPAGMVFPAGFTAGMDMPVASCGNAGFNTGTTENPITVAGAGLNTVAYANATNATSSACQVSLAGFGVEANTNYKGVCDGFYQGSATTVVPSIEFLGPTSPTSFEFSEHAILTSGTTSTSFDATGSGFDTTGSCSPASSCLTPTAIVTTATDMPLHIEWQLRNGANAGAVQLRARPNGAGTLTIQQGFTCTMTPQAQLP